ncbi:hypothetical protein FORC53_3632 [Vibrio vulnificus]|uniref:Uncharacterized protein n=1 Tax=Vibrio vulnificus TaxID=672 RepID=A0AAN1PTD6_VIBVL|nr:hypothetical protein FORC53_3632 [Vibrio vulnificus]
MINRGASSKYGVIDKFVMFFVCFRAVRNDKIIPPSFDKRRVVDVNATLNLITM